MNFYQGTAPAPGFDPSQGTFNWQLANNQITQPQQQAYQSGIKTDPVLDFFHKHPHIVKGMMAKLESLMESVVERVLVSSGMLPFQLDHVQALMLEKPQDPRMGVWKVVQTQTKDAIGRGTPAPVPLNPDQPGGPKRPQSVVETMDLESEHFFQMLTEEQVGAIVQMNMDNHQWAKQNGVFYHDPMTKTQYSPFAVDYQTQNGQWATQHHAGDQWGNQGHPPAAPGGFHHPYAGAMKGILSML